MMMVKHVQAGRRHCSRPSARSTCGACTATTPQFDFFVRAQQKFTLHSGATTTPHASLVLEMAPQTKADRSFGALTPALSEWILEAVDTMGFVKTTPVQHAAIPMFMKNSDVVVEAVTGSGKTLAYVCFVLCYNTFLLIWTAF
jgi:hypothetical protein